MTTNVLAIELAKRFGFDPSQVRCLKLNFDAGDQIWEVEASMLSVGPMRIEKTFIEADGGEMVEVHPCDMTSLADTHRRFRRHSDGAILESQT